MILNLSAVRGIHQPKRSKDQTSNKWLVAVCRQKPTLDMQSQTLASKRPSHTPARLTSARQIYLVA